MSHDSRYLFRLGAAGALAALLTVPAAARQVDAPEITYPESLDRTVLTAWLTKETDIRPESVVSVTPEALLAVMQSRNMGDAIAVTVRGEALTPETFARDKVHSWHATVQVDCAARKVRQGPTTGYAARNLLFDGGPIRPADAGWITPRPGDPLDQVRRALCEPSFQPPLTSSGAAIVTASAATAPARPAPPPAPPPKPPPPPPPPPTETPKPAAVPPPAQPAARVSVQITAAGSEAEAAQALAALRARQPERMAGLDTRVVRAVVGGKTYHRAIIHGFPNRAAATAFCAALKAAGQACFVRADLG